MKQIYFLVAFVVLATMGQAQELINNGTFDDIEGPLVARTADEWGMWSGNGGIADVVNGVVEVTPVQSADNWNMQVEQWNAAIENGVTYTITFDAWADAERKISLTLEDPANGYALLGETPDLDGEDQDGVYRSKWTIDITTDQTTYTRTVTIDAILDNTDVKFAFLLAETADKVYIDNVSMKEEGVSVASNQNEALTVFPNPATNEFFVNTNANVLVNVYNVAGGLMTSQMVNSANNSIDVSSFAAGMYIVKAGDKVQQLIVE